MDKAHLLIDANSSCVGLKRGQKRNAALGVNVARDCGDKSLSIAAAAEVRVRADGAHFPECGRSQSLASHCGEAAIDANPQKPAELGSLVAERSRLCEASEGYHLGKIHGLHPEDSVGESGLIRNRRA